MPPQNTELRCQQCLKWIYSASPDFDGTVRLLCPRCESSTDWLSPGTQTRPPWSAFFCPSCGKVLAFAVIATGSLFAKCQRCQVVVSLVDTKTKRRLFPRPRRKEIDVVGAIESRWRLLRLDRARRSKISVGLRFDVFQRDGFRCRYCGASPDDGAILEADHVEPQSLGGATSLENLVTACWDCNRGKSAKLVTGLNGPA